jgi:hypothetical protein
VTKIQTLCAALVEALSAERLKGETRRGISPAQKDVDRISARCKVIATGDLVRYTATGNPNGRVTDTLNRLLKSLGDDCRPLCCWVLAFGEKNADQFRERAGAILTGVLTKAEKRKSGNAER